MTAKTRKTAKRMREWLLLAVIVMTAALSLTGCAAGHPAAEKSTTQEAQPENDAPVLTEGETVSIDGMCEFHMDYVMITDHPEHYFEPYAGRTCVDFCITYEHLADYVISEGNVMEGKLIYSGQYEYDGVDMVKEKEGDSLRHAHEDIKPSEVRQMHYFFTVPEEVQDSGRMVELSMKIRGNDYRVIVREGSRGTVSGDGNDGASNKASGALSDGEAVVTEHAVFYVEYAEFTKKVTPRTPASLIATMPQKTGKLSWTSALPIRILPTRKLWRIKPSPPS